MAPSRGSARDHLAVALDLSSLEAARSMIDRLGGVAGWLKVGAELFTAAGPDAIALSAQSARVFLDTKLHDIPNTVASAVRSATRSGVSMLTVHSGGGGAMLRAARDAAEDASAAYGVERPVLVGVTVLTSLSVTALKEVGVEVESVQQQVERLADLAIANGLDGIVASALEAAALRSRSGHALRIVTPGIRPAGHAANDQIRTATAAQAIRAGANVLVVGRPILKSDDPGRAAQDFVVEIEQALAEIA